MKPIVLCIMDGVGIRNEIHGNAFLQAKKPNIDYLWNKYPHSLLEASGELVGLPERQMGNSEVGHLNIGAGRIVYQPIQLITEKIKDGSFFNNPNILEVINHVKENNSKLHVLGLLSDGGVHSHINHLMAIIDLAKMQNIKEVYLHLFLDGRDTLPNIAYQFIEQVENKIKDSNIGTIATISGRYYAMDRDNRWERTKKAYDAIVYGIGEKYNYPKEVIDANYNREIYDEFVIPAVLDEKGKIEKNDGLIVFNFRPDRLRQLFTTLTNPYFKEFKRPFIENLKVVTMMPVAETVICKYAYKIDTIDNTLGDYLSSKGLKQLRISETEKYAHVTYFFDGGIDKEIEGCNRILIPSPKIATYDLKPEMSAYEITEKLLSEIDKDIYDIIILNYANGDMVGHTGVLEAAIKAVETVDECVGQLYKKIKEKNGLLLLTADHGNCEYMLDENNNPITSHTTNKVPFIITDNNYKVIDGKLGDIAPTILRLLNLKIPKEMTGKCLIEEK